MAVALRLLDETGLADVTMRRLAGALDVQPSALYWHFTDKQTLLAAVSDRILDRAPVPPEREGDTWAGRALAAARALREALLAYRDGAELVASSLALGLGGNAARERLRAALGLGDFDAYIVDAGADAILQFLLGHVAHEQQRMQADSLGVIAAAHAVRAEDAAQPFGQAAAFDFGVNLLLDGLAKHVRTPSPAAPLAV
ncbi:TetR family transcriptional regulator [Microbacterium rhizomatis]|uniref:TetR family transcriptional regulator n=1 Tax=Microbacterium rhizomatis TaxID=1631477 RepID=A0A5J5IVZ5_9MICO|nr:TetR family transcriptional regulator [Microbacterium rhizomatis]